MPLPRSIWHDHGIVSIWIFTQFGKQQQAYFPFILFVIKEDTILSVLAHLYRGSYVPHQLPLRESMAAKDIKTLEAKVKQEVKAGTKLTEITCDFTPK